MSIGVTSIQTFVPFPSFPHCAAVLDYRRLGKQRVENLQLLNALRSETPPLPEEALPRTNAGAHQELRKRGWVNHPATRMWRGYAPALALYQTFILREWELRGYTNNIPHPYDANWQPNPAAEYAGPLPPLEDVMLPGWIGENVVHASHRSRLMQKEEGWYGQFGWRETAGLEYVWPDPADYTF